MYNDHENRVMFSVDSHDRDGDACEEGIYLHFGEVRIRVAVTIEEYDQLVARLSSLRPEIADRVRER